MGWLSSGSTSTQSTTNTLSPQAQGAQQTALNFGNWAASQPFQQYGGPWSAGFRPEALQAGGMLTNSANVGAGLINEGAAGARSALTYNPSYVKAGQVQTGNVTPQYTQSQNTGAYGGDQFMGKYFNPFLSNVAGGMVSDAERAREMQINSDEDRALAAGAYGGSRHGVMDSITNRESADVLQKNVGNLYMQGWQSAAGLGQQDAQRYTDVDRANADRRLTSDTGNVNRALTADTGNMDRWVGVQTGNANRTLQADQFNSDQYEGAYDMRLRAGTALAGMGDMQHDNYLNSAQGLLGYGQYVQGVDQSNIDRERARFNEWRDYPMRQSEIANNTARSMVGGGSTTQSSTPSTFSTLGSVLGTVGMGMALFSDENIKSDVRELGSDDAVLRGIKKTPVKTWRYDPKKGGPDDGGKPHIGPMAQAVRKNLGIGDGHSMPVVDVMGAHHSAIRSLAKKVDRLSVTDVKIKRKGKK